MKPTDYIEWDNLKDIPFFLCQVVEDREKQDLDIYYLGKRVLHDYDHVGHYLRTAVILFRRVKSRTADWVNLRNLWTLRNCVRENYNHGIGMNDLIFGENFDEDNLDTLTPLTKKRFDFLCKRIKELDPYATFKIVFFPEVSLSVVDLVVYLCQNCAAGGMGASPHTR